MAVAQQPVIHEVIDVGDPVEQYGKFEAEVRLTATFSNPFDYEDIRVEGLFTGPNGRQKEVEGFYIQAFEWTDYQTGAIAPKGNGTFRLRFAPDQPGIWRYTVSCVTQTGTAIFQEKTFECVAAFSPLNRGFVRSAGSHYLQFEDGDSFIPLGHNMAWPVTNAYTDYKRWIEDLSAAGGNSFRLWQCPWGLGLEWRAGNGYEGLMRYRQSNSFYLDWLFDYCAQKGVHVMVCLHHHGAVSTQVNPDWKDNPYNAMNGGPCEQTQDFFKNATAQRLTRNRLRYIIARWGYQRSIWAWELFNEVDWTDGYAENAADIRRWHTDMADFLREKDPNGHLITTSFADTGRDDETWNHPDIVPTQTHIYTQASNIEQVVAKNTLRYVQQYGKPALNAEFGLGIAGDLLPGLDPQGIHFHNSLWAALFSGALGGGMSWWWDSYIAPRQLYAHYTPLAAFVEKTHFVQEDFRPAASSVAGAAADRVLVAGGAWGSLSDTLIKVDSAGNFVPAWANPGQFLYGSTWNTALRRPPVFDVQYLKEGKFTVKTGENTGINPNITVWIDGVKIMDVRAETKKEYAISVPAGWHRIRVDNRGTDWIQVAAYIFEGGGTRANAYVLRNAEKTKALGWVLHNRYNHVYTAQNGLPPALRNTLLNIPDMAKGYYTIYVYSCQTGELLHGLQALNYTGTLSIQLPDFEWDVACKVFIQPVHTTDAGTDISDFSLYPNPAIPGSVVRIKAEETYTATLQGLSLLDAEGRLLTTQYGAVSTNAPEFTVPVGLPEGLYWLRLFEKSGRVAATLPLAIFRN